MARKRKAIKKKCQPVLPLWLGTFGDLMSLLLTFFILLLSMASFDAKKLADAQASMEGALSIFSGGVKFEKSKKRYLLKANIIQEPETSDELKLLQRTIMNFDVHQKVSQGPLPTLDNKDNGFLIRLPANQFFKQGSSSIDYEESRLFIKRISEIALAMGDDIKVEVRGHIDASEEIGLNNIDGWNLSSKRALSVAREMMTNGISPKKISLLANSKYKPIKDNVGGKETKNNRVDLRFFVNDLFKINYKKDILEQQAK